MVITSRGSHKPTRTPALVGSERNLFEVVWDTTWVVKSLALDRTGAVLSLVIPSQSL